MARFTRGQYRAADSKADSATQKRGEEFKGFVAIMAADTLRSVKLVASSTPTKWTAGNAVELLNRMEEIAEEMGEGAQIKSVSKAYDGPNPDISLRVGFGGHPYILIGDPNYVPRRKGREKQYRTID